MVTRRGKPGTTRYTSVARSPAHREPSRFRRRLDPPEGDRAGARRRGSRPCRAGRRAGARRRDGRGRHRTTGLYRPALAGATPASHAASALPRSTRNVSERPSRPTSSRTGERAGSTSPARRRQDPGGPCRARPLEADVRARARRQAEVQNGRSRARGRAVDERPGGALVVAVVLTQRAGREAERGHEYDDRSRRRACDDGASRRSPRARGGGARAAAPGCPCQPFQPSLLTPPYDESERYVRVQMFVP